MTSTRLTLPTLALIFLASVQTAGIARAQSSAADVDASLDLPRALIERYRADRDLLERKYPVAMSTARMERMAGFLSDWSTRLDDVDFENLDRYGKVDILLLSNEVARAERELQHERERHEEIASLVPFAETIIALEDARRRMEMIDSEQAATVLAHLSLDIEKSRADLSSRGEDAPAIKPTVANRGARMTDSLRRTLRDWYDYYHGYDPLFTWWVEQPNQRVSEALEAHARFLRETFVGVKDDDSDAIIGDPIGREALLDALRFEMIPYTPDELIAIAHTEYDWCLREMLRASDELGFGEDWHAALEHVKTLHVKPGEQTELIREMAWEAIDFVESRDLLTVPELAKEGWRMEMMSPERQKVSPYFLGGETIMVSFPTHEMAHEDKMMSMRGNNPYFSRAVVHHELIPGHHLQGFMTDRYSAHRQLFYTPFWIEGWALYWEMLLWDLGFAPKPEQRVGMLFWRMHRCARIVFSLSFHLEQMTSQECIEYLVENVGHERNQAEAEVRRSVSGDYGPLYQAAYMLGGLQFRALHRELVQSGRMSNREFHDAILRLGPIPVEMVRTSLIESIPLAREFESSWKFYGEAQPAAR